MYFWSPDYRQMGYSYYPYSYYGMPNTTADEGSGASSDRQYPAYPSYPTVPTPSGAQLPMFPGAEAPAVPTAEESYIENILRFNRGKIGTFYMTYENNPQWNAKVFRGRIETAGRDHIIISDPQTGKRFLLLMVNLDYVEFDEPLAYIPPVLSPVVQQELTTGVPGIPAAPMRESSKKSN
jgi:spore germination protein Q